MRVFLVCAAVAASALPAAAGDFTTAAEVRPILSATRARWVAVRAFDGKDLLYFTQIEAWRCGLAQVRYRVNDEPETVREMEPCYRGTAQPNAFKAADHLPYVTRPLGSISKVSVTVVYGDGSEETAEFPRAFVEVN
ncbi:hypothetical protein [Acidimangrovimonas pyrenivorans]|uniref:Uncharacterized protein n=1 Tax=Acidimangrovimonas pyrenivorans TaxID=2030798 RepID=A0ABV7AFH5_9RHOB